MTLKTKTIEWFKFKVKTLQCDIDSGKCGIPSKCMEKIAIERALRARDPGIDHQVKIDGGRITFNYKGFKYEAFTPKIAKRSLIRFDSELEKRKKAQKNNEIWVSKVEPHEYVVEAMKMRPVMPVTPRDRTRLQQIREARERREAVTGVSDKKRYNLRYRVAGMHTAV